MQVKIPSLFLLLVLCQKYFVNIWLPSQMIHRIYLRLFLDSIEYLVLFVVSSFTFQYEREPEIGYQALWTFPMICIGLRSLGGHKNFLAILDHIFTFIESKFDYGILRCVMTVAVFNGILVYYHVWVDEAWRTFTGFCNDQIIVSILRIIVTYLKICDVFEVNVVNRSGIVFNNGLKTHTFIVSVD